MSFSKHVVALLCIVGCLSPSPLTRKKQPFKAPTFKAWKKCLRIFWFSTISYKKEVCSSFPHDKKDLPLCVLPHCCLSIHFAIDQKTHLQKKLVIVAAIEHFNFQRLGNILLWFIWSSNILYRRKVNTLKVLCRCL